MKKSISQSVFPFAHISSNHKNINTKKIEGMDISNITNNKSKNFTNKINTLKNKPKKQALEQEYVQGLQNQIHYLEMQLKLLKQKQISKHSQVDQLETFFGDGIPINENILGMKNQFNTQISQASKMINKFKEQIKQRQDLLESLKMKNNSLATDLQTKHQHQKITQQKYTEKKHQLIKEQAKLKKQISITEQQLRTIKAQTRKIKQKLNTLNRTKQISLINCLKYNSHKHNKLNDLREQILQKQKQYNALQSTYQQMKKQQDNQQYVLKLQEENLRTKKKKIVTEKQLNALLEKISEKRVQLEVKLKERRKEINNRMDVESRLEKMREQIQKQNGLSVEQLEKIAKQREMKQLEKIVEGNTKLGHYVDHYSKLLSKLQDSIEDLGIKRPDLKKQIKAYEKQIKNYQQQHKKQKQRQYDLCGDLAKTKAQLEYLKTMIPMISDENSKNQDKIKINRNQRQRILEDIKPREKQLQLIQILKSFSLEEVQLCNASNMDVQQVMVEFMRNWQILSKK